MGAMTKGSIIELYWNARVSFGILEIENWFCSIRTPLGISDEWILSPSSFSHLSPLDLLLDYKTSDHVFNITGIGNGSIFNAKTGAGKISYSGLIPDPVQVNGGTQTEESSNFNYSALVADDFGNWTQTFSI
jgi:hypothetical protein